MSATELKMQVTVELVPQLNDVQLSPLAVQHLVDKGLLKFCSNTSLKHYTRDHYWVGWPTSPSQRVP